MSAQTPQDVTAADVRLLMQQIQSGILLLEEQMDVDEPGKWYLPPGRRRGSASALRYAWGQLSIAWINLSSYLMHDLEQEPWTIPPLQSRDSNGTNHSIEWGPEGHMEITPDIAVDLDLRSAPPDLVRVIPTPPEPRYTLEEARRILEVCQAHDWAVETSGHGKPVAVRCRNCDETRAVT